MKNPGLRGGQHRQDSGTRRAVQPSRRILHVEVRGKTSGHEAHPDRERYTQRERAIPGLRTPRRHDYLRAQPPDLLQRRPHRALVLI